MKGLGLQMENKNKQHQGWVVTTSIALVLLSTLYFLLIFPEETKSIISQYMTTILVVLFVVLVLVLTAFLNNKRNPKTPQIQIATEDKKVKAVEHLIWRNRYVLEAKKTQLINEDNPQNREKWADEKIKFARQYIFPVVPETAVPLDVISGLIEKSIRGGSFRGVRPPTYSVTDIKD